MLVSRMNADAEAVKAWLEEVGVKDLARAIENADAELFDDVIAIVRSHPLTVRPSTLERGAALGILRLT